MLNLFHNVNIAKLLITSKNKKKKTEKDRRYDNLIFLQNLKVAYRKLIKINKQLLRNEIKKERNVKQ